MNGKAIRKHATSLVLVTAALGLGAYVWLVDRDRPTTSETEARKDNLLPVFRRDDITEIVVEHDGASARIVRRDQPDAGDYMFHLVTGDVKVEDAPYADQISVERLFQALEFATRVRAMEGDIDRKELGLDSPSVRITVRMGAISYTLALGGEAKTPAGARYVELQEHGVFVISKAHTQDLDRPIDAYRTRRIIPYVSTELAGIEIDNTHGATRIDRGPWGGFRVANMPGKPRVSSVVFDRMLGAFADATAERFVDAAAASDAIAKARDAVRIVFVPKEGDRAEITVGGSCPDPSGAASKLVVLARKAPTPVHVCVPASVLADLQVPASAFVERRALPANPDDLEAIEIARGDAVLDMARKGGGWHVRKPEDREIEGHDVKGFLTGLVAIEGTVVPDPDLAKLGLDPPRGTVTLHHPELDEKQIPPQILEIGAETESDSGPSIALRRREDGVVLLCPREVDRLLQPSTTLIRSTQLSNINVQRLRKVDVSWEGGHRQVLARKDAGFEMLTPTGYEVDAPQAMDLFDAVARLQAERWVAERDDGSFGLSAPSIRLVFEADVDEGDKKRVMLIGAATAEGRFARWEPDTGVFVVPRSLEMLLQTWAVDRSVFMIDPNEVQALTLKSGDRTVRIVAEGTVWRTAAGSSVQLPEASIHRIRQTLIDMRADGVVHLGAAKPEEGLAEPTLRIEMQPRPEARPQQVVLSIGRGDVWRNTNVFFARRKGIDATFAIAQSKVRPMVEVVAPRGP